MTEGKGRCTAIAFPHRIRCSGDVAKGVVTWIRIGVTLVILGAWEATFESAYVSHFLILNGRNRTEGFIAVLASPCGKGAIE